MNDSGSLCENAPRIRASSASAPGRSKKPRESPATAVRSATASIPMCSAAATHVVRIVRAALS